MDTVANSHSTFSTGELEAVRASETENSFKLLKVNVEKSM